MYDDDDRYDDDRECRYCNGRGYISVDGGSLAYHCPDCTQYDEEDEEEDE